MSNHMREFRDAIQLAGLTPPQSIEPGKLHRFPGIGKSNNNTAGWCKLFPDGLGGSFGDWSSGFSENWQAKRNKPFSSAEREAFHRYVAEAKAQAEAELKAKQAKAATRAAAIWNAAAPAPDDHAYLTRKGIKANGARLHKDTLVIPVRSDGELLSLQFIGSDGDKKFLTSGRKSGGYFTIGKPGESLCIAEGFATGASIYEITGHAVVVAFDAGNLLSIARAMRRKFPDMQLVICADDDTTQGNIGLNKAKEAAQTVGGLLAVPDFGTNRKEGATDFNDMAAQCGKEAVKRAITNASAPAEVMHQIPMENLTTAIVSGAYFEAISLCAADVVPAPIGWIWDGWLARGKLHILAGAPGTGKTTLSLSLAASLTTAGRWPDGTPCTKPRNVLIWSGEDDPADTLVPRLSAAGADLKLVHFLTGTRDTVSGEILPFDPSRDISTIEQLAKRIGGVSMLIIDPIVSATGGADSHKNAEVRRALQPVVALASLLDCCVIGISHFSKGTQGRDPTERVTGSLAFGALARVVLATAKLPDEDGGGRILCRTKSNIGPDHGGVKYELLERETNGGIFASYAAWGECVEGSARELLAQAEAIQDDTDGEGNSVADWLRELLNEESGSIDRRSVMKAANAMGFKERTVHRTRTKLGIIVKQHGFGKDKRSMWVWPDIPIPVSSDPIVPILPILPSKLCGTHGTHGGKFVFESDAEAEGFEL